MIPEDFDPTTSPQRFQSASENGNWRELVCDELEWLARPDVWGVQEFPEPTQSYKHNLAEHHINTWIANTCVRCPTCKLILLTLFAESGFALGNPDSQKQDILVDRKWVAAPRLTVATFDTSCECGSNSLLRLLRFYERGQMTQKEVWIKSYERRADHRYNFTNNRAVEEAPFDTEFYANEKAYRRWLSLELCGPNPFRPVAFDPAWRTSIAIGIASQMYDTRDFSTMPILADALQDAGCENDAILRHCREKATHVRGCWVVDLVLEK
jgi:hypothetical protein